jgi:hypothetical protein
VLDLEVELAEKVEALEGDEAALQHVEALRRNWIKNTARIDQMQAEVSRKKLDLYRRKAELMSVQLALDEMNVLSTRDACHVQELTHPQAKSPEAVQLRELDEPNEMAREPARVDAGFRQIQAQQFQDLTTECYSKLFGDKLERERRLIQLESYFELQQRRLKERKEGAEKQLRAITEEYLVFRHNAKVTHEVVTNSRRKAEEDRNYLEEKLQELQRSAELQHSHLAAIARREVDSVVHIHRVKVMQLEHEVTSLAEKCETNTREYKRKISRTRQQIRHYDRQYEELQDQRRQEIREFTAELGTLRERMTYVEAKAMEEAATHLGAVSLNSRVKDGTRIGTGTGTGASYELCERAMRDALTYTLSGLR